MCFHVKRENTKFLINNNKTRSKINFALIVTVAGKKDSKEGLEQKGFSI